MSGIANSPSMSTTTKKHFGELLVFDYDPGWPSHFNRIYNKLHFYLAAGSVEYVAIEHIGSTAVPGCAAKPNIDIVVIVPDAENAGKAREALIHEPDAAEHYKCYGDGGIRGRISMKFHDRYVLPDQSVYIIRQDDPSGQLSYRACLAVRDTLRLPENEALKQEYGHIKKQLAATSKNLLEYGHGKTATIRKILTIAGWTNAEIAETEKLDYRTPWVDEDDPF